MDFSKSVNKTKAFDPSNPAYRYHLWVTRPTRGGPSHVHVFWGKIGACLGGLLLVLWLGWSAGSFIWLRLGQGVDEVSLADVATPWNRHALRIKVGQHDLALGRTLAAEGDLRGAWVRYAAGLAEVPSDFESRRALALLEFRLRRPDLASRTLADGLDVMPYDPRTWGVLFGLLHDMGLDETAATCAQSRLPEKPDKESSHLFLAGRLAEAQYALGRYRDCQTTIGAWSLGGTASGEVLLAQTEWDQGQKDRAVRRLQLALGKRGDHDAVYVALERAFHLLGDHEEAERMAKLRSFESPASHEPRVDLIYCYAVEGKDDLLDQEVKRFIGDFTLNDRAIEALMRAASEANRPDVALTAYHLAQGRHLPLAPFRLALVKADLGVRDYARARLDLDAGRTDLHSEVQAGDGFSRGLSAVIDLAQGASGRADSELTDLLNDPKSLRFADALYLARQMRAAGGTPEAYRLLERAHDLDPNDPDAAAEAVRIAIEGREPDQIDRALQALLSVKKPDIDLARSCLPLLTRPEEASLKRAVQALLAGSGPKPR